MSHRKSKIRKNTKIYCGNDDILPENYDKMGTRFKCLQKGFGVGMMLEQKAKQSGKTKVIKRTPKKSPKMYCGDKHILPNGYDVKGTKYQCLRKGVGAGIFNESKKELKEYKEMKEGKIDDYKRFGSSEKKSKKSSRKRSSRKKRSNKKKSGKKLSQKRSSKKSSRKCSKKKRSNKSKKSKKKSKKAKISSYNLFVKNNYTRVKNKYKLKKSEDVFIKLSRLWKRN